MDILLRRMPVHQVQVVILPQVHLALQVALVLMSKIIVRQVALVLMSKIIARQVAPVVNLYLVNQQNHHLALIFLHGVLQVLVALKAQAVL